MSKKSLLVMGLTLVSGVGLLWAAEPPQERPRPGREERVKQDLGLTDAQKEQLQALRLEERKASIRRRADRELLRIDLMELLKADTVDEKAVRAKAKQIADLEAQGIQAKAEHGLALRKIVSAEQAQKLMRMMHRPRGPRPARGGPGGPGGPGGRRGPQAPHGPAFGDASGGPGEGPGPALDEAEDPADFADDAEQR